MKMRSLIIFFIICVYILGGAGGKQGPGSAGGSDSGSSDSGDSEKTKRSSSYVKLELEDLIGNCEKWKQDNPDDFEYLKHLLYIPFVPSQDYERPTVLIYYPHNDTNISRSEKLNLDVYVWNKNPEDIRSDLFLWLEVKSPGVENFTQIGQPVIILRNEYSGEYNSARRTWSDVAPFEELEEVGEAKFRIKINDMHNLYDSSIFSNNPAQSTYGELRLDVINNPPSITSAQISPNDAKHDDDINYMASVVDPDGDKVEVTLHVLDELENERCNITDVIIPPDDATFSNLEHSIFGEMDAGKNFSYYYSYNDGIDVRTTDVMLGPHLRSNPKIWIKEPRMEAEDENYYWWQDYSFGLQVKNPELEELKITLYTSTPAHTNKKIESTIIGPSEDYVDVEFSEVNPFDVLDADQTFSYRFQYSAPDQNREYFIDSPGKKINPKIVRYAIYSPVMVLNILFIIVISLLGGIMIERNFYRRGGR
jgi:hypothetical protein